MSRIKSFLEEIKQVCEKHNLAISHEDEHGAFIVTELQPYLIEWLLKAQDETKEKKDLKCQNED